MIVADSPGRTVFGAILTAVTATFLGNGRPKSCRWTSTSSGSKTVSPRLEARTLEVGQDVQFLDGFPGADQEVARPGHRGRVVGAGGRRLDRGGLQVGRPRERVDRAVERAGFQLRPLTRSPQDGPCLRQRLIDRPDAPLKAHAGRAVEQHHDQAFARRRLGREHVRPGEQGGDQGDARHPHRQQAASA